MVLCGLVIACLFAGSPTFLSPLSVNATIDGVVLLPSLFAITCGSEPSITATQEFVVPKSIPIILPILSIIFFDSSTLGQFACHRTKSLFQRKIVSLIRQCVFYMTFLLSIRHIDCISFKDA